MNTYDEVRAFGMDRYTVLRRDAERMQQVLEINRGQPAAFKRPALKTSGMLDLLRTTRSFLGKLAHGAT